MFESADAKVTSVTFGSRPALARFKRPMTGLVESWISKAAAGARCLEEAMN